MNELTILKLQLAELEQQGEEIQAASLAVVLELQNCWENTPNELEYVIGQLAELLFLRSTKSDEVS